MKTPDSFLKKQDPLVWSLALFSVVIHLLFNCNLEYHRDELLYFSLGQHPDFGFASVPPLIGWIAWIMQKIFGYSLFAVRLFPALMSGVMVLIVADIARELGGKRFAPILAGAVFYESVLKKWYARLIFVSFLLFVTYPLIPFYFQLESEN